jgi:hypothetical protein
MNLLESKVIQTEFELEIFIDNLSNIEILEIELPEENSNDYKLLIGLDFIRLRDNNYYGTKTGCFGLKIDKDLNTITLFEPENQSIFSVKNSLEKAAALELIEYILTASPSFKEKNLNLIKQLKQADVINVKEMFEVKEKLSLIEKLNNIHPGEIKAESLKAI